MSNILVALNSLVKNPQTKLTRFYKGSNRANSMGHALESYVKDLFASSFKTNESDAIKEHSNIFSYLGNQNNPPDAILKNGDAIEVKKIESKDSKLALNSSYPKDKLYKESKMITEACKQADGGNWEEKDIIYIIGVVGKDEVTKEKDVLQGLWFIYGDCYAATRDTYERIANMVTDGIKENSDIEFSATNEIARINRVDPLGITYLRVRGMWGIENPIKVFSYLDLETSSNFFTHVVMKKEKFLSFPEIDRNRILNLTNFVLNKGTTERFFYEEKDIKNPNNPANMINAVVLSYIK